MRLDSDGNVFFKLFAVAKASIFLVVLNMI
jgi:hypothetical protein